MHQGGIFRLDSHGTGATVEPSPGTSSPSMENELNFPCRWRLLRRKKTIETMKTKKRIPPKTPARIPGIEGPCLDELEGSRFPEDRPFKFASLERLVDDPIRLEAVLVDIGPWVTLFPESVDAGGTVEPRLPDCVPEVIPVWRYIRYSCVDSICRIYAYLKSLT